LGLATLILATAWALAVGGVGWGGWGGWSGRANPTGPAVAATPGWTPDPLAPPPNRPGSGPVRFDVLVGATVHVSPTRTLTNAAILLQDGIIVGVEGTEEAAPTPAAPGAPAAPAPAQAPAPAPAPAPAQPAEDAPAAPPGADDQREGSPSRSAAPLPSTPPELPEALRQRARGARVWDARGLHIYAGFIDPYVEVDAPRPDPDQRGAHWNARIMPQRSALDGKGIEESVARTLRSQGFTAAAIAPRGGIVRGSAAVVSLARPDEDLSLPRPPVYRRDVYHAVALETGGGESSDGRWGAYPNSQMGAIALLRQTLADADWLSARGTAAVAQEGSTGPDGSPELPAPSLALLGAGRDRPAPTLLFSVEDELEVLRALKIAREFDRRAMVVTGGTDFRRLEAIARAAYFDRLRDAIARPIDAEPEGVDPVPLIVPLNFPEKPRAGSIGEAEALQLRDLMTWEQAPTNPRRLREQGLDIAFTTARLRDRGRFLEHLRTAVRHGLSEPDALAALTTAPAKFLGLADQGLIAPGARANLVVTDGPLFARRTKVRDVWVDGVRHEVTPSPARLQGQYELSVTPAVLGDRPLTLLIDAENTVTLRTPRRSRPEGGQGAEGGGQGRGEGQAAPARRPQDLSIRARGVSVSELRASFVLEHEDLGTGAFTFTGIVERSPENPAAVTLIGQGTDPQGARFTWRAVRTGELPPPTRGDPSAPAERGGPGAAPRPDAGADPLAGVWACTISGPPPLPPDLPVELSIRREGEGYVGTIDTALGGGEIEDLRFDPATGRLEFSVHGPDGADWVAVFVLEVKGDTISGRVSGPVEATIAGTRTARPAGPEPSDAPGAARAGGGEASARSGRGRPDDAEAEDPKPDVPEALPGLPFGAYALPRPPEPRSAAFVNATVWTSGPAGVIPGGAVVVSEGRIVYVGPSASLPRLTSEFQIIDCTGKHITPGIIDCHSHTGISRGVNESGQTVTAEVRIHDVTNPDAINWYRQLAGGVTTVNSLHGSANPIGGQNAVLKVRWGAVRPEDMHFAGPGTYSDRNPFLPEAAPGARSGGWTVPLGIKFALGENVKQSNWGERNTWRYPQTRMGVEAIIRDRFTAAREYAAAWARWSAAGADRSSMPRRDLELEALAEVLGGTRWIHCHSYRQDEILMLARLCEAFGVRIGTYQHGLECYKVAEAVSRQAIGASLFSDWWAFKVEVQDAIPYAGPILHEQGVLVSYNSDSDELARRMNVEAGKARKYSRQADGSFSVSEEEALKFITINPARQLGIDARVGSLEVGKDADLVVWSGPPLSSLSRCERTWIDGAEYYALERDAELRARNAAERRRLLAKVLADRPPRAPERGEPGTGASRPGSRPATAPPAPPSEPEARRGVLARMLDDSRALQRERLLDMVRRGVDPADARMGECGCDAP
jgi:imidazolonepropionase-like amidohydrolase